MADEIRDDGIEGVVDSHINDDEPSDAFNKAFDEILADPELDQDEMEDDDLPVDDTEVEDDPEQEEIPDAWVVAGTEAGLSEDEIVSLANTTPKALEALVNRRAAEPEPKPVVTPDEPKDNTLPRVEFVIPDTADEATRTALEAMAANQNVLIDRFNEAQGKLASFEDMSRQQEQAAIAAHDRQVDDFFDSQVDECPAIGKNENMTPTQLAARQEIYGLSERIAGKSLEDRLEKAVRAYNGIHGVAEKTLAKKLYKQKQRFTPRPQSRKTKQQFKDADSKAMHAMEEKARELGLDLN